MSSKYPYYKFAPNKYEGRYFCSNGYSCAIVALVTPEIDWAAYIGGSNSDREQLALEDVAAWGSKLSEEDARHFFSDIDLPYRY